MLETNHYVVVQSQLFISQAIAHKVFNIQQVFKGPNIGLFRVLIFAVEKTLRYWYHPVPRWIDSILLRCYVFVCHRYPVTYIQYVWHIFQNIGLHVLCIVIAIFEQAAKTRWFPPSRIMWLAA